MRHVTRELASRFESRVDKVAAIEARGALLAHSIGAGIVPVRKPGKLPAEMTLRPSRHAMIAAAGIGSRASGHHMSVDLT